MKIIFSATTIAIVILVARRSLGIAPSMILRVKSNMETFVQLAVRENRISTSTKYFKPRLSRSGRIPRSQACIFHPSASVEYTATNARHRAGKSAARMNASSSPKLLTMWNLVYDRATTTLIIIGRKIPTRIIMPGPRTCAGCSKFPGGHDERTDAGGSCMLGISRD